MRIAIKLLMDADAIYMCQGWENSQGARIEHSLAQNLELPVIPTKETI